ncbi:regulatory subunit of cyclin-dependent kinase [Phyllosticta capitalensis]
MRMARDCPMSRAWVGSEGRERGHVFQVTTHTLALRPSVFISLNHAPRQPPPVAHRPPSTHLHDTPHPRPLTVLADRRLILQLQRPRPRSPSPRLPSTRCLAVPPAHNTPPPLLPSPALRSSTRLDPAPNMNMDIDVTRRNKKPRPLSETEKERLEEFVESIHYSARYSDSEYEYRHVQLPKQMLKVIPKEYFDGSRGTLKLLWEEEWRALGITQSLGWEHYEVHEPEPHILLFKRPINYQPPLQH